jgi:hypothetical protein
MRIFSRRAILLLPWRVIFAFGVVTGWAMCVLGLAMRLQDSIPADGSAAWFGVAFFAAMGVPAGRIGWMLVLEGAFWIAALSAIGVRNHWGWWSTAAAGMISVVFFPGGTLAGIVVLAALIIRLTRAGAARRAAKAGGPAASAAR